MLTFPPGTPILDVIKSLERIMYFEDVLSYLDYIGYDEYTIEFDAAEIAHRISLTIKQCHSLQISHRMCALVIFGQTILAITRSYESENQVKH